MQENEVAPLCASWKPKKVMNVIGRSNCQRGPYSSSDASIANRDSQHFYKRSLFMSVQPPFRIYPFSNALI